MSVIWRGPSATSAAHATAMTLVTGPATEPISLDEAKAQCRVTSDDEIELLQRLIVSAREQCEAICDLKLITQTWDLMYDAFPLATTGPIYLPIAPVQLTPTAPVVSYVDTDGDTVVWSSAAYRVVPASLPPFVRRPGHILPVFDGTFPTDYRDITRAVTVRVVAGYGLSGASVPAYLVNQMLQVVATEFSVARQAIITGTIVARVPDAGTFGLYEAIA